jgi:DNA-binding response OmpR family regulator
VKILICCENDSLRAAVRPALEAGGHEVTEAAQPRSLADRAHEAGALLVDAAGAKLSMALLRDRGFAGRTLLVGADPQEELSRQAAELGADGALTAAPAEDLARRFARGVGGRRRVLVLEESEATGQRLAHELEGAGYEARHARTVQAATALMLRRDTRPDLILAEAKPGGEDGARLCRFIKRNDRFRSIRVLLCSSSGRDVAATEAGECGADGFVLKTDLLGNT